jgi:hypothetical protein
LIGDIVVRKKGGIMANKNLLIGLSIVALGGIAVVVATQVPKNLPEQKVNSAQQIPKLPDGINAQPPQQMPAPTKDVAKLNAMQAEVASLSDEAVAKEIDSIKEKVKQMGMIKPGQSSNFNLKDHPEAKDMLMRMGLLRVEKAKRDRKQADAAKQDS